MRIASAKAKGRNLQQLVVLKILEKFSELTPRDVTSTPMGVTGPDVTLSEAAFKRFPFSVECKAQESLNIWSSLKQAEQEAREGTPLLVFKRNRTKVYVALALDDFMNLIK